MRNLASTILTTIHLLRNSTLSAIRYRPTTLPRPVLRASMPIPFFGALFSSTPKTEKMYPVNKSDSEWQAQLSPTQFRILREKGTESPGSGTYDKHHPTAGTYNCAGCNAPLYTAQHKFKSGCGWPAFFDAVPGAVERHVDRAFGMSRTEIVCAKCGGHLGHVFKGEGYDTPTDERHCVNSVSLKFDKNDKVIDDTKKEGEGSKAEL
ncbi:putative methionine-R-sulfoxide reductase SelR [Microthyrium microscopicum]|uniref:Peptide-methionine (R)-S-oxide reductase n=1 Tax=Microthyrium microscopicum TaxID=703497 RepID=A0A6A6UGU5_9PEZI|nr:putative methionine-R-sulfoxide reductase SelR [Microthyrium microscopicum]